VVVVKDGPRGALASRDDGVVRSPAVATAVVDTTGAGDAFDAGFQTSWLGGDPLERSLAIANACGGASSSAVGGVDGQIDLPAALAASAG
jgi:sugar/nucleoside kinase (ribokinase family)